MAGALSYPVRVPTWALYYQNRNVTVDIIGMVIDITYSDGSPIKTEDRGTRHHHRKSSRGELDEVEVTLEDRDRRWQGPWFPQRGDIVTLTIGYENEQQLNCGDFQVDELELKGPPDTFHLKCIAAGITPSLRTPRSYQYENVTLLQVASTVASRNGLTVVGIPANINVSWMRLSQHHESDLHYLRTLALAHNYDFSVRGTQLVFYSRTALEQRAPVLTLDRTQTKSFEFKTKTQQVYRSASVGYQNPTTKQLVTASSAGNSPTGDDLHIIARSENAAQAQLKADSALHDANMFQVTGKFETEGTPLMVAGMNIMVSGFATFNGKYHIEHSRHRLERGEGYSTEVELRQL